MGSFEQELAVRRALESSGVEKRLENIEGKQVWTLKSVRSVNGVSPDDLGNVSVSEPGGVTTFGKTGGTARQGAISLTQGTNVTITDNGDGTFTVNATTGTGTVPLGGTTGQILAKASNADDDLKWEDDLSLIYAVAL